MEKDSTKKSSRIDEKDINGPKNDQEFEDVLDNVLTQEINHKDVLERDDLENEEVRKYKNPSFWSLQISYYKW